MTARRLHRISQSFSGTSTGVLSCLLLFAGNAWSQQAAGALDKAQSRIAGHVVSAADGHALAEAALSLSNVHGGALVASVLAGDNGAFIFEDLPAGKYALSAQRRGFVGASYEEHEQFSTAVVTNAGLDTGHLVLRLEPEAQVMGRVFDEDGELVRGAQVTLYREGYETGKKQIRSYNTTQTDPFGEFAFGQLRSGRYFVTVRAWPWYAVAPAPAGQQSPLLTGVDPSLNVAYPLTFYGDVTKSDDAAPMVLKAGDRFHADIHLSPVRASKISIRSLPGSPGANLASLQTAVFDGFEQLPAQLQQSPDGTSEVVGLPPAQYRFETFDPASGNKSQMGEVNLTAGSSELDPFGNVPEGSIQLKLAMDDGTKLPPQTSVALHGTKPGTDQGQVLDSEGKAIFRGVPPDDYHFLVLGSNHVWQTVRLDEGGKALPQDHRQLAAGESVSLKLVIAGTVKAVEGLALREGKPVAGAMIVLVPVDAVENASLFRRDQSDQDGTFALPDVPAGRYILVAIENGWKLEWGRPEVLTPFLVNGIAVNVPSTQREPLRISAPVIVQPHP